MQIITLPILVLALIWHSWVFGVRLLWSKLESAQFLVFMTALIIIAGASWQTAREVRNNLERAHLGNFLISAQTNQSELEEQLTTLENLLTQSPTHQDALINASIVACELGLDEKCHDYREKARYLNPTHPYFSTTAAQ